MEQQKGPFSILLIDSDKATHASLQEHFAQEVKHPVSLEISTEISDALRKIKQRRYHLILVGEFSEEGISELLKGINREKITTPLILLIDPEAEGQAQQFLRFGATDYILKTEEEIKKLPFRLKSIFRNYELESYRVELTEQLELQNRRLLEVNEKLSQLSIRDEVTGLYNHRYFQERLVEEFTRGLRYGHPVSFILLDLDQFRQINEDFGHAVGDEVLREVAALLVKESRLSDLISRFGGEEFAILLPHVDYKGALEVAERLREVFAEHTFLRGPHQALVTVSIGVSAFPEDHVKHGSELVDLADQALFRAKAGGRNRVFLYRDLLPTLSQALPNLKINEGKVLEFQKRLSEIADTARRGYIESSKAMITTLDVKDRMTAGHSARVARLGLQVAEIMGMPLDEAEVVEHAGLLHDIGKICVSDEILIKPGRLTIEEYQTMKQHPYFGYRILKPIKFLQQEATLVLYHHEWYNGEGYPCRLTAHEIPLGARIVALVDSYDTMRLAGERYKTTMSVEEATNELIACAGTQFDPEVVQAFVQLLLVRKELGAEGYNKKLLKQAVEAHSPH